MTVLIDNGHGLETKGKQSPDGRLNEALFNRNIANRALRELSSRDINAQLIVPENHDVPLKERVRRANSISDAILISIHVNAANSSGWHKARGWCAFVANNASLQSIHLGQTLFKHAQNADCLGNRYIPPEYILRSNFYILRNTRCPAVLTENLFMDNREDLEFLLSEYGQETIAQIHINGIIDYLKL